MIDEYIKCLTDPYYFFIKYCKIYNKETGKLIKSKITRKQYERFIEFKNKQNFRKA